MSEWCDFTDLKISLRAMADIVRLNMLHQLAGQGEITVTELVSALAISQPLVSWHLRILRRAGLVSTRRQGREVLCSLDMARFVACQQALTDVVTTSPPHTPDALHTAPPPRMLRAAVEERVHSQPSAPEGTASRSRTPARSAEP